MLGNGRPDIRRQSLVAESISDWVVSAYGSAFPTKFLIIMINVLISVLYITIIRIIAQQPENVTALPILSLHNSPLSTCTGYKDVYCILEYHMIHYF